MSGYLTINQSVASLQYVKLRVVAIVGGDQAYNPTTDVVQFGFLPQATNAPTVVPSSWITGSWETDVLGGMTAYVARVLVGPAGDFVPTANTRYWGWVKVTDNPEVPVLGPFVLNIT